MHRFVRRYATLAGGNLEYDFARRVLTSTVLEGFTGAGERKYFGDDRLELPFIHEREDLIQLPSISIDNEKDTADVVLLGDTKVTSTPPFRSMRQERSRVSPPMVSRTMSTS